MTGLVPKTLIVTICGCFVYMPVRADLLDDLPVRPGELTSRSASIRHPVTFTMIHNIVGVSPDGKGFVLDLGDTRFQGMIYTGPYPFEQGEADYDYARYRLKSTLKDGRGVIPCAGFFTNPKINANDWPREVMTIACRLELNRQKADGSSAWLGFYDSFLSFRLADVKKNEQGRIVNYSLVKVPTVVEGPFVSLLTSGGNDQPIIAFETDEPCGWQCEVETVEKLPYGEILISESVKTRHQIKPTILKPGTTYRYTIKIIPPEGPAYPLPAYTFTTAPRPGAGRVRFAFVSDSREGVGGGEQNYRGCNFAVLSRIAVEAFRKEADFFLFGGDLVNGYTSETEDFRLQLQGWKQALAGYWRSRAVYPCMGNHETLLNIVNIQTAGGGKRLVTLDKWPYATDSAEAVFAEQFWNPRNAPMVSDPRRPTYKENVFSFQYGPVKCIAYNNNYWYTSAGLVHEAGGSPEGYIMADQMAWIEKELARADVDESIRYVVLYAQEPVFPCGGHVGDCMWWNGNNNYRAHTYEDGKVRPADAGMIEVRNRFWKAVSNCRKVAAVLAGDEHEYHRLRIDGATPVGIVAKDDADGDGILESYSPNPDFRYPTWQITAGTAGAPYYAREETPWEPVILSSQTGYCLFEADERRIRLTFYTMTGQVVDQVDDLMAIKTDAD